MATAEPVTMEILDVGGACFVGRWTLTRCLVTLRNCRIDDLVRANVAKRETALRYLKELETIAVVEQRVRGREKLFVHTKLMRLLAKEDNEFPRYL